MCEPFLVTSALSMVLSAAKAEFFSLMQPCIWAAIYLAYNYQVLSIKLGGNTTDHIQALPLLPRHLNPSSANSGLAFRTSYTTMTFFGICKKS